MHAFNYLASVHLDPGGGIATSFKLTSFVVALLLAFRVNRYILRPFYIILVSVQYIYTVWIHACIHMLINVIS